MKWHLSTVCTFRLYTISQSTENDHCCSLIFKLHSMFSFNFAFLSICVHAIQAYIVYVIERCIPVVK